MTSFANTRFRAIRLVSSDQATISLGTISAFLWDITILHDRLVLAFKGNPRALMERRYFSTRNARDYISSDDKLVVRRLTLASPLSLEVTSANLLMAFSAVNALTTGTIAFLIILEKIQDMRRKAREEPLNQEKLSLEILKLRRELNVEAKEIVSRIPQIPTPPSSKPNVADSNVLQKVPKTLDELITDDGVKVAQSEIEIRDVRPLNN